MSALLAALGEGLTFLLQHLDVIEDVYNLVQSGASKDSIKAALRTVKVQVSDEAIREELGL